MNMNLELGYLKYNILTNILNDLKKKDYFILVNEIGWESLMLLISVFEWIGWFNDSMTL